jgi:predicted metal-dependent hydrolase
MQLELPLAIAPVTASTGTLRYIRLGGEIVGYRLRRARRRSIGMVIDDDGLRVAAPVHTPIAEVEAFIREKARWVLQKLRAWRAAPKPQVVNWSDGANVALLGAPVAIELLPGRRGIHLENGRLGIGLEPRGEPAALRKRGIAWIKEHARAFMGERLKLYARELGVPTPALALSSARRQWGLCREDGRVRLNWRLIHLPVHLIDYVVAHELAHLREMNHSARFWAVLGSLYPGYQEARSELRDCNHRLPIL